MSNRSWDLRYLKMAQFVADEFSKDDSTKIGAIIVGPDKDIRTTGYNGFARGVTETEIRKLRPIKYKYTIHGEANALMNALRSNTPVKGCKMYVNISCEGICSACAGLIIQAGLSEIVGNGLKFPGKGEHWEEDTLVASHMLLEVGVHKRNVMR